MLHRAISPTRIGGTLAAAALFAPALAGLVDERLCAAFLDASLGLLGMSVSPPLHPRRIEVPLRGLVLEALAVDARAMLIAHNHPQGSREPSAADRHATRRLAEVGRALGIRLIDHLLFAGEEVVSFRALGLL